MMEAMERETVTRLGTRPGVGLLILSSLQRVELHRHRVWRCNIVVISPVRFIIR